ncbi:hypothetical protein [Haladaptatus sp. R4]|nr:hypothetical protein [Haladaptatus sp. R4]
MTDDTTADPFELAEDDGYHRITHGQTGIGKSRLMAANVARWYAEQHDE